jgi:flagellar biosynthesis protein FlhG
MKSLKFQDHYEVLGVPRNASREEIRSAFEISRHTFQENSLATYSLFSDAENQKILELIAKAYETLYNPETRRQYDAQLEALAGGDPAPREQRPAPQAEAAARPVAEARPARAAAAVTPAMEIRAAVPKPPAAVKPPAVTQKPENHAAVEEFLRSVSVFDGATLKKLRQIHGISLDEMAERTKIRRAYLEYLEDERFQFLPAAVYIKGFVSIVASTLGLPAQRVADEYMSRVPAKGS